MPDTSADLALLQRLHSLKSYERCTEFIVRVRSRDGAELLSGIGWGKTPLEAARDADSKGHWYHSGNSSNEPAS